MHSWYRCNRRQFDLTLQAPVSTYIKLFSILFSIHFLWFLLGEFANTSIYLYIWWSFYFFSLQNGFWYISGAQLLTCNLLINQDFKQRCQGIDDNPRCSIISGRWQQQEVVILQCGKQLHRWHLSWFPRNTGKLWGSVRRGRLVSPVGAGYRELEWRTEEETQACKGHG